MWKVRGGSLFVCPFADCTQGLSLGRFVCFFSFLKCVCPWGIPACFHPPSQVLFSVGMRNGTFECQQYRNDNDRAVASGRSQ